MIQYEENNDDIDIREQKMNKYNDELFKIEMKEFESGPKRMKSTNE